MMKFGLLGAAAGLLAAIATPVMAQEATSEPGALGFYYPNADYLTGGWGTRTPPSWTGHWPRVYPGYVAAPAYGYGYRYGYAYAPGVSVGVGPVGVTVGPAYDAYAYDPY